MDVFHYPPGTVTPGRYAATIGFFDGVHRGHQFLFHHLRDLAALHGMKSMAVTFCRHPQEVVQSLQCPEASTVKVPQLLTTLDEKVALISATGIDVLVCLQFDEAMAAMSARQFMGEVLCDRLHVCQLLMGYDNRFGHGRRDTFDDYCRYGQELGMEVVCASPVKRIGDGAAFSSSLVRRLLSAGDVEGAADCLGRNYALSGHVVHGEHVGTGMGFPTANIVPDSPQKLIPARGAYAVTAVLADGSRHHAMTNIGTRPTFYGQGLTLETNIFDMTGDLYGQPLTIEFEARLRDEQHFPSQEALKAQLALDREHAELLLSRTYPRANYDLPQG